MSTHDLYNLTRGRGQKYLINQFIFQNTIITFPFIMPTRPMVQAYLPPLQINK